MVKTGLSELEEKARDYETLIQKILEKSLTEIQYPSKTDLGQDLRQDSRFDLRNRIQSFQKRLTANPFDLDSLLEYAAFLFEIQEDEKLLSVCGKSLQIDEDSEIAHDLLGLMFQRRDLFNSAYLLFSQGLSLSKEKPENTLHIKFHEELYRLIHDIHERKPEVPIDEFGFSTKGFRFHETGFYLPDFDYNFPNVDYKTFGMRIGKERTLASIHYLLNTTKQINGKPHAADNCPFLEYCGL